MASHKKGAQGIEYACVKQGREGVRYSGDVNLNAWNTETAGFQML